MGFYRYLGLRLQRKTLGQTFWVSASRSSSSLLTNIGVVVPMFETIFAKQLAPVIEETVSGLAVRSKVVVPQP